MSIRSVNFSQGEYYHIYNRGNSKQKIFCDKNDYIRFIGLLFACNQKGNFKIDNLNKDQGLLDISKEEDLVGIGAYCLMPNHFHILITEKVEGGISKFMQKLGTSYSMYFNKKYKRTGTLFEGKFKSQYARTDRHLKYLFSYIHLNPIKLIQKDWKEVGIKDKEKALEYLNSYEASSFNEYIGIKRPGNKILDIISFPKYFPSKQLFKKEIFDWLKIDESNLR